jgi:uncharacterized protein
MPYHLSTEIADCSGVAVVKTETGEVMGCHTSREDANAQLAVLHIAEADVRADSYKPTDAMAEEAQRGLDWRDEYNRGGTAVGVARARDISNRTNLTIDTIGRMVSYFARHEIDKDADGFSPGEDGYPSAGRIAWALWGGDVGRSWAKNIYESTREQVADMEIREEGNAMYPLNERQTMQYGLLEALVESYGQFDQSSGANGAHYMAEQPYASEGMQCSNCVFYEGPRGCELVHGDIDPSAICKLWVIPESLISGIMPGEPAEMMTAEYEDDAEEPMPEVLNQRESVLPVYWRMLQLRDASNTIKLPQPEVTGTYSAVDVEERLVQGRTFEVRATPTSIASASVDPSLPLTFRGYAAVFNSASQPLPFIETIRPGAFKRSLQSGKEIRMYLNHNSDQVLASTRSGTLRLTEDTRGLMVEADLPPTSYGKDISILMQRGDVHSMSFGFTIPTAGDSWSADGRSRELREVILHEVSIVTGFPAYEGTAGATITD